MMKRFKGNKKITNYCIIKQWPVPDLCANARSAIALGVAELNKRFISISLT
jgi:hypothetical protein